MAETWNSIELARLLQAAFQHMAGGPEGSLQEQTRQEVKRVIERLERTCTERGCPTCGSSFYTFEEAGEP